MAFFWVLGEEGAHAEGMSESHGSNGVGIGASVGVSTLVPCG